MSTNNQLVIDKLELPDGTIKYSVSDVDVEGGGGFFVKDPSNTLEEAIKVANDYMEGNTVEYGLSINLE